MNLNAGSYYCPWIYTALYAYTVPLICTECARIGLLKKCSVAPLFKYHMQRYWYRWTGNFVATNVNDSNFSKRVFSFLGRQNKKKTSQQLLHMCKQLLTCDENLQEKKISQLFCTRLFTGYFYLGLCGSQMRGWDSQNQAVFTDLSWYIFKSMLLEVKHLKTSHKCTLEFPLRSDFVWLYFSCP